MRSATHLSRAIIRRMAKRKNTEAVKLGKKGGLARKKNMSAAERSASSRKAALARWKAKGD